MVKNAEFERLLSESRLTVGELAEVLGLRAATVARWGEKVPQYAIAYLEALVLLGGKS